MKKSVFGILFSVTLGFASIASATPAFNFTPAGSFTNNSWEFGINFRVNAPVTVDALMYFAGGGMYQAHQVGLYTDNGQLLASALITPTSTLDGIWREVSITPLTLNVGTYQLVGVSNGDNYTWDGGSFTVNPNITYLGDSYSPGTALQFQNGSYFHNDVSNGFWGPNMDIAAQTSSVPEPSTFLLLGAGLAAVGFLRKRRTL